LRNAASVNGGRTVVRPLQTMRWSSDADDHRMELYAAPVARFTKFGDAGLTSDLRSIAEVRRTSQNFEFVQGDAGAERQSGSML
jgi:hypothetical protein